MRVAIAARLSLVLPVSAIQAILVTRAARAASVGASFWHCGPIASATYAFYSTSGLRQTLATRVNFLVPSFGGGSKCERFLVRSLASHFVVTAPLYGPCFQCWTNIYCPALLIQTRPFSPPECTGAAYRFLFTSQHIHCLQPLNEGSQPSQWATHACSNIQQTP